MLQLLAKPGPTGRLLRTLLQERGLLEGPVKGVVNYGYQKVGHLPTLNANAGKYNKYQELVKLDEAGVRTVPFSQNMNDLEVPFFGRKLHHTQGRDIKINGQGDYYTELVPKAREFRVWTFRGKVLATYKKKLSYKQRHGRGERSKEIWNWHNGFSFEFVRLENVARELKELAIASIRALDLDFGGVDILLGNNDRLYVLEVNSAPGTQGTARQGLTSLVNCIERWATNGFKKRQEVA